MFRGDRKNFVKNISFSIDTTPSELSRPHDFSFNSNKICKEVEMKNGTIFYILLGFKSKQSG
ncbi:hypothetical protein AMI01nite_16870 [Aneurinibacillus migulanus]|nr:hypothetical protein AMI01nite_16870 [Aneurinibacillus migulanus]